MSIKNLSLLLVCLLSFNTKVLGETVDGSFTPRFYFNDQIVNSINTCQGELIEITIKGTFQGKPTVVHDLECDCISKDCISLNQADLNITPSYINYSLQDADPEYFFNIFGSGGNNYPPQKDIVLSFVATETVTLSIDWLVTFNYVDCNDDIDFFDYSNSITIQVGQNPVPTLSSNKNKVNYGENYSIVLDGCQSGVLYGILENCETLADITWNACPDSDSITIPKAAPNYSTNQSYQAVFDVDNFCDSGIIYSNKVNIKVDGTGTTSACNNPTINMIETKISDPAAEDNYSFHSYMMSNNVCSFSENCNMSTVWDHLKSDIRYQVPSQFGLGQVDNNISTESLLILFEDNIPLPDEINISNCQRINIETNYQRMLGGIGIDFLDISVQDITEGQFEMCGANYNFLHDPILIQIDEENKCITNYTLPGHFFHPGKVKRCVVESCDSIQIQTLGIGFHDCEGPVFGSFFSKLNTDIGPKLFQVVDELMINEYD